MRVQFAEGLQSQGVASNQVVLQSTSSGDFVLSAEGVVATFRLDVVSTNVDAVKSALESYVSSGKYDTALKGAASEFSSVKTQVDTSSYKVKKYSSMNGVVVVLLILLVIFVLLFIGLGYTLWVYVHPMEPEEVNSMWDSFEEDRRKNLEQRRAERAERKKKLIEMEEQAALSDDDDYSDSSYSDSDSGSDNGGNGDLANSMYDDLMARPEETDDDGDYNTAIRSANDSSMFAQQAAENTDIVPDTNMERDADMGEVRRE